MPRNNAETIEEIRKWKRDISSCDNIPMNPHYKYDNPNDIYERMMAHIKGWVESVFGCFTDTDGSLTMYPRHQRTQEFFDWWQSSGVRLTDLHPDWFEVAWSGKTAGRNPLPYLNMDKLTEKGKLTVPKEVKDDVVQTFFPAYRALRDSFDRRWFFEWLFNRDQYLAERDALRVMTRLIKSMGGFTQKELDAAYKAHKILVNDEPKKVVKPEPVAEEAPKVEEKRTIDKALDEFKILDGDEKGFYQKICKDMTNAIEGSSLNASALKESIPQHIYAPLSALAGGLCKKYDDLKADGKLDEFGAHIEKAGQKMFEKAFDALCAVNPVNNVSVFSIDSLKDRIVTAQKFVDIMLKGMSPVGFFGKEYEQYGKGHHILEHTDKVKEFLAAKGEQVVGNTEAFEKAFNSARREFGARYRGEKPDTSHIFKIGYRPSADDFQRRAEGKALGQVQMALKLKGPDGQPLISDPALRKVINENATRYKFARMQKGASNVDQKSVESQWAQIDEKLGTTFQGYDAKASETMVEQLVETQQDQLASIKVQLTENAPKTVPPTQPKPQHPNPQVINH